MKLGIGAKIILTMEVALLLLVGFSALATDYVLKSVFKEQTYTHLQSVAVLKESAVAEFLNEVTTEIEFLNNRSTVKPYLLSLLTKGDSTSKEIIASRTHDLLTYKKVFTKIKVLNKDGLIVYSTEENDEGKIAASEPYFLLAKDKTYIQEYYFDLSIGQSVMLIGTPILDEEGSFVGVLAGRIDVGRLNKLMVERSGMGSTGETYLVNSYNVVATDLLKMPGMAMKKTIYLPQITSCLAGKSANYYLPDYNGDMAFGYYRWLPEMRSCLIAEIDAKEALAPAQGLIWTVVLVLAGGGVLMGFLGVFQIRAIVRPIKQLHEAMVKMREGNFEVASEVVSTNDEIGEMSKAFNQMAGELKVSYTGMEDKVKEKTGELETKLVELEKLNSLMVGRENAMVELKKKLRAQEENKS
jgi:adenylate cyclase